MQHNCLSFNGFIVIVIIICSASVLRHVYLRGGVGVGALTKIYGGKKEMKLLINNDT